VRARRAAMLDGVLKPGEFLAAVSGFSRGEWRGNGCAALDSFGRHVGGLCAPSRAPPARPMGMTISGLALSHGAADGDRGAPATRRSMGGV